MNGSSHFLTTLWKIALVVFLCLVADSNTESAQADNPGKAPAQTIPAIDDSKSLKQGGYTSITLSRQQTVIQCIDLARDAIGRKDYLAAMPLMERVLSETDSFVPVDANVEVGAHVEVQRMMRELPTDLRQRLDEPRRVSARRAWNHARLKGPAEVVAFLRQFGDLPIGVDAWWWLGCHQRDHSRNQLAAAAFGRAADHLQATAQQRVIAFVAKFETLLKANRSADAIIVVDQLRQFDKNLVISIGGKSQTLKDWTSEHHIQNRPQPTSSPDIRERSAAIPSRGGKTTSGVPAGQVVRQSVAGFENPSLFSEMKVAKQRRPVLEPIWKHTFDSPLNGNLEAREQTQRDQGVRPLQILRPMILDNIVIVRTLDQIQAFDLALGTTRWSIPNTEYHQIVRQWIHGEGVQSKAIEWAQRRSSADSMFGRMSTDGRRLFFIQEPDRSGEFLLEHVAPRGGGRSGPRFNVLSCNWLDSGKNEWEIGGDLAAGIEAFRGYVFLGCPLVVDDILYVIAQRETTIQLLAINLENGSHMWSLNLGASLLPITDDLQRSRVACPIVWHDGVLLCSTSAGAVVAIDPLLKTIQWGYRYAATTIAAGDLLRGPNHQDVHNGLEPWWDSWREPFVDLWQSQNPPKTGAETIDVERASASSILIFASPETDELHAIRCSDGKPIWRIPREEGAIVAGIAQDLVLIVEGDAVRGHFVSTGQLAWRTPTAEISGPGAVTETALVLPAQSGGVMLLDIRNGQLASDSITGESTLGAIMDAGSSWIAFSRRSLVRLPLLEDFRKRVERELESDPRNEALEVRAAFLDWQASDILSAHQRLQGLQSPAAQTLRRQVLIDELKSFTPDRSDIDRPELARQLKELIQSNDDKFTSALAIGMAAISARDDLTAVEAALEGLTADLDQSEGLVSMAGVNVRKDRVLLGLIDQVYRLATPVELSALDQLFVERLKIARKSRDRSAVQRLVQQWRGLDWSRRVIVLDDERVLRKRSPAEAEILLLDAAGSNDRGIAVQALEKLAARFDRVAAAYDAAAVRRQIHREAIAADPSLKSIESEQLQEHGKELSTRKKPLWPATRPTVADQRDVRTSTTYSLIPVHAEPGSLAARLDICVERTGNSILFRGESFFQSGQDDDHERIFKLPPTVSPYRGPSGYMLREAWGIGRIVLLLVGTELFGISPLDENGEPNSRFLWSNPIELHGSPSDIRVVVGKSGANEGKPFMIDQLNRPIGKIGPVRAGYLCYQKGTKLIAVETETGNTLWEHLDLPADATVLGDDHLVFLWRDKGRLEILSSIDGRKVNERACVLSPENMLHQRDSRVWTVSRDKELRLELHDFRTGNLVWARKFDRDAQTAVLDQESLVVSTPEGRLHIFDARSGVPLCEPLAADTTSMTGMITWQDPERWFVALIRPPGDTSLWKSLKPNESYRRQFVSATLLGLDRERPRILWKRELIDEPISLDQSRAAPVLIQIFKSLSRGNVGISDGILRVVDKRTGETLFESHPESYSPSFLLNPDPQQGILELKLPRELIRIDYSGRSD